MGGAAVEIDVGSVRLVADGHDFGAEFPQRGRRDLVGSTIGAVDRHPHARQRDVAWHGPLGKFNIAVVNAIDTLCPADRLGRRQTHGHVLVEHRLDLLFDLVIELEAVRAEELDAVVLVGIVRCRDHHTDIGAQRARQHGHSRRRNRAKKKDVKAGSGEPRDQGVFQHVARQARILADHDAIAVLAALEEIAHRDPDLHRHIWRHRVGVRLAANTVGSEIAFAHKYPHCSAAGPFNVQPVCSPPTQEVIAAFLIAIGTPKPEIRIYFTSFHAKNCRPWLTDTLRRKSAVREMRCPDG